MLNKINNKYIFLEFDLKNLIFEKQMKRPMIKKGNNGIVLMRFFKLSNIIEKSFCHNIPGVGMTLVEPSEDAVFTV